MHHDSAAEAAAKKPLLSVAVPIKSLHDNLMLRLQDGAAVKLKVCNVLRLIRDEFPQGP